MSLRVLNKSAKKIILLCHVNLYLYAYVQYTMFSFLGNEICRSERTGT